MHLKLGVWDQSLEPEYSRLFGSFFVNFKKKFYQAPSCSQGDIYFMLLPLCPQCFP